MRDRNRNCEVQMNKTYYDLDNFDPNDAPGLKGLALGCLVMALMLVVAVGTVLLLHRP